RPGQAQERDGAAGDDRPAQRLPPGGRDGAWLHLRQRRPRAGRWRRTDGAGPPRRRRPVTPATGALPGRLAPAGKNWVRSAKTELASFCENRIGFVLREPDWLCSAKTRCPSKDHLTWQEARCAPPSV